MGTEQEREDEFVLRKERTADVLIEVVLEMILQISQTTFKNLRLIAGKNHHPHHQIFV